MLIKCLASNLPWLCRPDAASQQLSTLSCSASQEFRKDRLSELNQYRRIFNFVTLLKFLVQNIKQLVMSKLKSSVKDTHLKEHHIAVVLERASSLQPNLGLDVKLLRARRMTSLDGEVLCVGKSCPCSNFGISLGYSQFQEYSKTRLHSARRIKAAVPWH